MDWKGKLLAQGAKLLEDERVMKLAQDERVIHTLMRALELRGRVQERVDDGIARVAKTLNLATQKEVSDLRRTLRKLERDLERERSRGGEGSGGPTKPEGR